MTASINAPYDVAVEELVLDERLQFRQGSGPYGTDKETIERYAECMKDGKQFPELEVIELTEAFEEYEVATLLVVGGFTRTIAAKHARVGTLLCRVREGTWQDARIAAFRQNGDHGKPRTSKEINAVIAAIEEEYPGKSVRDVARMANCSHGAVYRFRKPPEPTTTATPVQEEPPTEEDTPVLSAPPVLDEDDTSLDIPADADIEDEPVDLDTPHVPDPFAKIRRGRRIALQIAEDAKQLLKRISEWRGDLTAGSALIKYGVCEKAMQEVERHVKTMCPSHLVPKEAIDLCGGDDPSKGQGWLHVLAAERLKKTNPDAYAKLEAL